jgi:hypothetical protein
VGLCVRARVQAAHAPHWSALVPFILSVLSTHGGKETLQQALFVASNLAQHSIGLRDVILGHAGLEHLVRMLKSDGSAEIVTDVSWAIRGLFALRPEPPVALLGDATVQLADLLHDAQNPFHSTAAWCLADLTTNSREDTCRLVVGVLPALLNIIREDGIGEVLLPCVRIIGNICSSTDACTLMVVSTGVLPLLIPLMERGDNALAREVCWAVSNVTAGPAHVVQGVLDAGLVAPLLNFLRSTDESVQQEALWALCNCTTGGSLAQVAYLIEQGSLPWICAMLEIPNHQLMALALEGLQNIVATLPTAESALDAADSPTVRLASAAIAQIKEIAGPRLEALNADLAFSDLHELAHQLQAHLALHSQNVAVPGAPTRELQ